MTRIFFPRVGDYAGYTAVLLQYINHTAMQKRGFWWKCPQAAGVILEAPQSNLPFP